MSTVNSTPTLANPAPIGLLGFGLTTVLLNFTNAGILPFSSVIVAMGIFYGGLAQIVAGILEFKKGNTFGQTAFVSYGFFWLSFVGIKWLPLAGFAAPTEQAMALYLFLWGVFTLGMFLAALTHDGVTKFVFGSLTLLFFLLAIGHAFEAKLITMLAGYEGIVCGSAAIFSGLRQIYRDAYK